MFQPVHRQTPAPFAFTRALFASVLGAIAIAPPLLLAAESTPAAQSPTKPAVAGLSAKDAAFDTRFELYWMEKGTEAAFKFIEKEFVRDPTPHIKARYAEFLMQGKEWGAPDDMAEHGWVLAKQAFAEGSTHAIRAIAWDKIVGAHGPQDLATGLAELRSLAETGNANAMILIADLHLDPPRGSLAQDLPEAELWFLRAARRGQPHGLYRFAKYCEHNLKPADPARVAMLYYEAATRGSVEALRNLEKLHAAKEPQGRRAYNLHLLFYTVAGADIQTKKVKEAVSELESTHPEDPVALLAVGRVYASNEFGFRDYKKGYALIDKAAQLGLADARADRAWLLAEGYGVDKDPERAFNELNDVAGNGNARALARLGYYGYWGTLGKGLLPKNPAEALANSRLAADAGDLVGQLNAATCYEFGIGTPIDYAMAAYYYRMAAVRGSKRAQRQIPKLLTFVFKQ